MCLISCLYACATSQIDKKQNILVQPSRGAENLQIAKTDNFRRVTQICIFAASLTFELKSVVVYILRELYAHTRVNSIKAGCYRAWPTGRQIVK